MSLLTRRRALLVRRESAAGTDALASLSADARKAYAVLASDVSFTGDRERSPQPSASGTLSPELDLIGVASGEGSYTLQLRGSGSSTRDPEWVESLLGCGMQRGTGTKLAAETIRYLTTPPTTVAGGRFIRGEQVFGKNTLLSATWDSVLDSGNGLGTTPSVGDDFIAFPDASSEGAPIASGTLVAISGTAVTLRLSSTGRIKANYFLRCNAPGGGALRGYMKVTDDQPVMILCDESHDHGANTASLWGFVAQGTFANSMIVVGQQNGIIATLAAASAVTAAGSFLRPDSDNTVSFTVGAWSGATPVVGDELIKQLAPGRWLGACQVVGVNGSTITARVYYGTFSNGDIVYQSVTLSSATLSSDQVIVRGASLTVWDSIDGFLRGYTGKRGSYEVELRAGAPGTVKFSLSGTPGSQAMTEPITGLNFVSTQAPRWESGVADYLGIPLRTISAKLTMGNETGRAPDANAANGTLEYRIPSREPTIQWVVHRPGHTGWQIENAIAQSSWRPLGLRVGASATNLVAIVVPRMQLVSARDGEEGGILTADVTARCVGIAGDDELIIFWR